MDMYNFSAGPAMLPREVMKKAQEEFCNYRNSGSGIMELSHRGSLFTEVIERAEQNIRDLMNISDDYAVIFVQGGASMQFCMIPMNLLPAGATADYADTGVWGAKAAKEAKLFGNVNLACSSKETKYDHIPAFGEWKRTAGAAYLHITSNNTVAGTQYHQFPEVIDGVPMLADMSSDIMSRVINVNDFGLIYAGAQKNLGPSGMALVIIRKDLAERTPANVPTMLRYNTYIENKSLFNTPPTFAIYMLALVTDHFKAMGGIGEIEKINDAKAAKLYDVLDSSDYYRSPVARDSRSNMNVVWRMPTEELEAKFIKEAAAQGMTGLKGHRLVGGLRASIYNAMPMSGIDKLIAFMRDFEKNNG
ncbi:3-phosphoserine/phosphohydroxythreonine transaminase [Victivallis sp. Marseille-Q1083]|uniref:3-phosphoserine/phosphohydroxythreonine transaminase n=1 Tax=Victivallis sp. Marseille-Q1083 TaxID=2717288 RepID=UPI00158DCF06|nr:3-phosphoserine/phosphohydroxythreonine transaminase [Victivallis sp. Marseille-Q1083]